MDRKKCHCRKHWFASLRSRQAFSSRLRRPTPTEAHRNPYSDTIITQISAHPIATDRTPVQNRHRIRCHADGTLAPRRRAGQRRPRQASLGVKEPLHGRSANAQIGRCNPLTRAAHPAPQFRRYCSVPNGVRKLA